MPPDPRELRAARRVAWQALWSSRLVVFAGGVLVSLACFAITLSLTYRLVALELGDEIARVTVLLIAFCPMPAPARSAAAALLRPGRRRSTPGRGPEPDAVRFSRARRDRLRRRVSAVAVRYGAYALAAVAMPLSYPVGPQPLASLPRYEVVLFPLFAWGATWVVRRRIVTPAIGALAVLLGLFTAQFATWRFVA